MVLMILLALSAALETPLILRPESVNPMVVNDLHSHIVVFVLNPKIARSSSGALRVRFVISGITMVTNQEIRAHGFDCPFGTAN